MPRAYLTRRVKFAATHRYGHSEWTDEQNEKAFGVIARAGDHGHDYVCELTIAGEMDPLTGWVCDLGALDAALADEVTGRFDGRNINSDVPEFADGLLAPSGENLARFIFDRMRARLPETVHVEAVTVAEDFTLSATYKGEV